MKKKTTKSRGKKIALAVVLIILAAVALVTVKNYKNLKALYIGLTASTEQISTGIEQNKQDTANALSNAGLNISKEDFDKMNDGSLTPEEIEKLLKDSLGTQQSDTEKTDTTQAENAVPDTPDTTGDIQNSENKENTDNVTDITNTESTEKTDVTQPADTGNKAAEDTNPSDTQNKVPSDVTQTTVPQSTTKPTAPENQTTNGTANSLVMSDAEYNEKVAEYVAKMYVIKSEFLGVLDEFEASIKSQYLALPKEQRTTATKAKIVSENMEYVSSLEAQCDARVDAVINELSALMKANGKDTALVDAIKTAYINEKELKKAYYVSLYK